MTKKNEMRKYLKNTYKYIKSKKCSPSTEYKTKLANELKSDYAVLLGVYTKTIEILNLNEKGFTNDGKEWVLGALGNMRLSGLPIFLVNRSQMELCKALVMGGIGFYSQNRCGYRLYKLLKTIARVYN